MRLHGIRMSGLMLGLLVSGCAGTAEPATPAPIAVSLADASGLTPKDEIDGLDLATEADGTLHVVWLERIGVYGDPVDVDRIVYRRGEGTPLRWGPPIIVAEGRVGEPQVVAARDGVHVFAGGRLHHRLLPAGGGTVQDLGEVLGDGSPQAGGFDAIASGNDVTIAFVTPNRSHDQTLYAVRWNALGATTPFAIANFTRQRGVMRPSPALFLVGRRMTATWAENVMPVVRNEGTGRMAYRPDGRVHAAWSDDGGQRWGSTSDETASLPSMNTIAVVAAAGTADAPVSFFASYGLFMSRLTHGKWTPPMRIAGYEPGSLSGSAETSAVAATQCGGHTAVAWVDARYRRSDRRWWNPLGGIPWSDNPDWYNNDLFVATRLEDLDATLDPDAVRLWRQTPDGSFTRDIAIAQRNGELIVLRTGRARVRKSPSDGTPPAVLQSRIPCNW